jgi:CRISPR-associated protein Csd2
VTTMHTDPSRRHDAVVLIDVTNGNPNGDPDNANLPRVNPYDGRGLITDVALKRKVRNWVAAARPDNEEANARYKIYVEEGVALNAQHRRAYEDIGEAGDKKAMKSPRPEVADKVRRWMCANFFDIRLFGAVMSTEVNAGQVKGPVQATFAESLDPIFPLEHAITRGTVTKEDDLRRFYEGSEDGRAGKNREMGRKSTVPYGLYRTHVYYSPYYGHQTGTTADDLALLWEAFIMGWDLDRSSARGDMACRGLWVFSHENPLGNAPSHSLLDRVVVSRRPEIEQASNFSDYKVSDDPGDLPGGVYFSGQLA